MAEPTFHLKGVYDFTLQEALEAAGGDIEHLEDAGIIEWSTFLLNLEADGWQLTRADQGGDGE